MILIIKESTNKQNFAKIAVTNAKTEIKEK